MGNLDLLINVQISHAFVVCVSLLYTPPQFRKCHLPTIENTNQGFFSLTRWFQLRGGLADSAKAKEREVLLEVVDPSGNVLVVDVDSVVDSLVELVVDVDEPSAVSSTSCGSGNPLWQVVVACGSLDSCQLSKFHDLEIDYSH